MEKMAFKISGKIFWQNYMRTDSKKDTDKIMTIVKKTVADFKMFSCSDSLLVGVSGGPDSVALLNILLETGLNSRFKIGIAHLNHSLRGKESDDDAKFVAQIAENLNLPCYIIKVDVKKYRHKHRLSMEAAARRARYNFFFDLAEKEKYNKIVLGHNYNDNAELILMNIFRGSGSLGIAGIPPVRSVSISESADLKHIIRPLINLPRSRIIEFLTAKKIKYVTDRSNYDTKYLRNKIRHNLIPLLEKEYNPEIVKSLCQLASITRSQEEWIDESIEKIFIFALIEKEKTRIILSVPAVKKYHMAAKRRIIRKAIAGIKGDLKRITLMHVDSVVRLLEKNKAECASLDFPGRVRVARKEDSLLFIKEKKPLRESGKYCKNIDKPCFKYKIAGIDSLKKTEEIFIRETGASIKFFEILYCDLPDFSKVGSNYAFFDMDLIEFPLVLRNVKEGDSFKPFGMIGTQKVSKFFIKNKVNIEDRAVCPVLVSKNRIIWLAGHRIDNSVRVRAFTKKVLQAKLLLA